MKFGRSPNRIIMHWKVWNDTIAWLPWAKQIDSYDIYYEWRKFNGSDVRLSDFYENTVHLAFLFPKQREDRRDNQNIISYQL